MTKEMFALYFSLSEQYRAYIQQSVKEFGLKPVEVEILCYLVNNPGCNTIAQNICEQRGLSKSLVSYGVGLLLEKNYIVLLPNPLDKRSQLLSLSKAEPAVPAAIEKASQEYLHRLLAAVPPQEQALLATINRRMLAVIQAEKQ